MITPLSDIFIGLVLTEILSFLKTREKRQGGWGFFWLLGSSGIGKKNPHPTHWGFSQKTPVTKIIPIESEQKCRK